MLQLPFFMEVFMIAAWCIWNERNAWIFNGKTPSLAAWKLSFAQNQSSLPPVSNELAQQFVDFPPLLL
jgi:hypothetical protein